MKNKLENLTESLGTVKGFVLVPTLRLPFFLLMAAVAFVGGYFRSNAGLYTAAAFFMLLFLVSVLYGIILCIGIRGSFSYENAMINKGESDSVVLNIVNRSFLPVFVGRARFVIPNPEEEYNPSERVEVSFSCSSFSSEKCLYDSVFPYSGRFSACLEAVYVYDPFGLFCCRFKKKLTAEAVVMPLGNKAGSLGSAAFSDMENSRIAAGLENGSDEFLDLRGYAAGDSLRDIHWKLSAKNNELVVIRRASEEQSLYALVCDCGAYFGDGSELLECDEVFETVFGLLKDFSHDGVKLIWNGGSCTVGAEDDSAAAIAKAIRSPRHEPGELSVRFSEELSDCAGLIIVTARISDDIMNLVADFRTGSGFRIPIDIILCGSLQKELPEKRLTTLNVGLIWQKGGNL